MTAKSPARSARPALAHPRTPRAVIAILLIVAMLLALWPVCAGEFLSWDDSAAISGNPTLLPPTWHSVAAWWTDADAGLWIPITYTAWGVLALAAQMPGEKGPTLNPYVFHVANLILHVLAALVVFRLLEMLIKRRWPAAAGAAIFALHPVQVEPVAWAVGLRDILGGLLTLLAIWQYLIASNASKKGGPSGWRFAAATALYILALLAKPTAIVAPLIAAALEIAMFSFRSHFRTIPSRATPRRSRRIMSLPRGIRRLRRGVARVLKQLLTADGAITRAFLRLGLWLILAIPIILVTQHMQPISRATEYVPLLRRPIVALDAIAFYVWKTVWPLHLCTDYGRAPWKIFADGQAYWTWIVPVAIAALLIVARRMPMVIAGAAVFVLGMLPVLGLVGFDYQGISTVADRYLYLSMCGVGLIVAALLSLPAAMRHPKWLGAVTAVILGLLAYRSFTLTWTWHDNSSLWAHILAVNPLSTAANDTLSIDALHAGDYRQAIDYAEQSIRGNPRRPHGYVNLANVYAQFGQPKNAVAAMMQAYRLEPRDPQVLADLGAQLVNDKQLPAAAERFREALAIDPANASAEVNLAIVLNQMGRRAEGFAEIQRAAKIDPDSAPVLVTLGDFYREMGKFTEARSAYESALRAMPGYDPALTRLHDLGEAPATRGGGVDRRY